MEDLIKIYYRKHAVTLYKMGYPLGAFQELCTNSQQRGDLRSMLYLGWMLLHGRGCPQSYKLSARVLKRVIKKKGTWEAQEASKLLALVYVKDNTRYADNKWIAWTLSGARLIDLNTEDSFL